jgi:hypothetical protein
MDKLPKFRCQNSLKRKIYQLQGDDVPIYTTYSTPFARIFIVRVPV